MAKKQFKSGLTISGISPNILLQQVESTAPFLFSKEIDVELPNREYLKKLIFYKKNLKQLNNINLSEYFHICLAAHWATAGTYVPTDVDNQIREGLWKHPSINKHIEKMAQLTIESWSWDYGPMTSRKSYNEKKEVISTHEGTWLSVAIGAYCALKKKGLKDLYTQVQDVIIKEIRKEEALMCELRDKRDHINFIKATPLVAHNFGDLDRVMVQWEMHETDEFCKSIYKLGHIPNKDYDPILVYSGKVNKLFTSKENHRHMSLRQAKALRKSTTLLVPVAPFMDDWGKEIGKSQLLNTEEKASIIAALFEGYKREKEAFGYARAYGQIINSLQNSDDLSQFLAFDLIKEIKSSDFEKNSKVSEEEFLESYKKSLNNFKCEITDIQF